MHPDGDVADAGPGVETRAECPEGAVVRGQGTPGESQCRSKKLAALVEHALLNDLVRPQQKRLRDRQPQHLRGLEVDDRFERGGLLNR